MASSTVATARARRKQLADAVAALAAQRRRAVDHLEAGAEQGSDGVRRAVQGGVEIAIRSGEIRCDALDPVELGELRPHRLAGGGETALVRLHRAGHAQAAAGLGEDPPAALARAAKTQEGLAGERRAIESLHRHGLQRPRCREQRGDQADRSDGRHAREPQCACGQYREAGYLEHLRAQ